MIPQMEAVVTELKNEAVTTRKILARVPADKLTWRPHPHSMTLGQLAMHIALIPGSISRLAQVDEFEIDPARFAPPQPTGADEILGALDAGIPVAEAFLSGLDQAAVAATWKLKHGEKEVLVVPRAGLIRSIMLNHWYHHRGQLSVYLRLLDVKVPTIYGPSYDENPFLTKSEVGATA